MTSGGYRTVSSRATVARFRKYVSPLTGVVSRLERMEADVPLNTNYHATHNFAPPAQTVNDLRAGLGGASFGKGSTAEQGEASALMEAIERYTGIFQGDEIRVTRRFTDFPSGEVIHPNKVLLFSDAQYRRGQAPTVRPRRTAAADPIRSIGRDRMVAGLVAARQALQIPADHAVVFFLPGPRRLPGGFQRLCRRQHARGSHRSGIPGTGRTGCLRNLVVQSSAAAGSRPQPVRQFLHPRCANPVCRNRTPALGARRHQRSRRFRPTSR